MFAQDLSRNVTKTPRASQISFGLPRAAIEGALTRRRVACALRTSHPRFEDGPPQETTAWSESIVLQFSNFRGTTAVGSRLRQTSAEFAAAAR